MKNSYRYATLVFLLLVSPVALAQPRGDTKILLPLVLEESISGAFGSQWITRIAVLNHGPRPVVIDGYILYECQILCDSFRPTPPGITFYPKFELNTWEVEGYLLFTTREDLPWVDVEIHAQDISRQSLTWGTEIPAVPETEAFTAGLALGDIPIGPRFRSLLRVYDFDPAPNREARIAYRIYGIRPLLDSPMDPADGTRNRPLPADPLIASGELNLVVAQSGLRSFRPGYTRLNVSSIPAVQGYERIRIELGPLTPGLRYWAFVAVTNNETQHVTTITP